jgi:type I restriction enzyme R subunit
MSERITQNRVIKLIENKLGYTYIGNLQEQDNSNVEEQKLKKYLQNQGYSDELIRRSVNTLVAASKNPGLYNANKEVYKLLRYGASEKENVSTKNVPVKFINWDKPLKNDFYIAEEVTVKGEHTKRPDIVLYVNGIAVCVIELKASNVSVSKGIRQNLDNQLNTFIKPFFSTVQLCMAGNDTEGLRIGVIKTPEKHYIEWKEDLKATDDLSLHIKKISEAEDYKIDRHIISLCQKERLLDILYNFIVFDGGIKKLCRHNQYFGVIAARKRISAKEGGIIWHTQGSGKSLTMVWLSRWIKEENSEARILIITDRNELDEQIETKVFGADGVGDTIYRTKSCEDLIETLNKTETRVICSLVHKFGRNNTDLDDDTASDKAYDSYIEQLKLSLPPNFKAKGEFYIFVDECHRTQSGKLHRAMTAILPDAIFIGFTGTPLLSSKEMKKRGIKSSIDIFGTYIHTYNYIEAVSDKVVLDLNYEARDIPQGVLSQEKIDIWFESKTRGLSETKRAQLKKRWGTLKEVYSSESRLNQIVLDIMIDMEKKERLSKGNGNAILVSGSIYEACKYYKLFIDKGFDKCAIITSYSPEISDIKGEATGEARDTEKRFKHEIYEKMLNSVDIKKFEKDTKEKFLKEPGQMKLLIVVDKLLTGFDAPKASYLYIDKSMRDHALFQAICRVNRLDGDCDDKDYGYIIDYKDLFKSLEKTVTDYTTEAFDGFELGDVTGLLKNRVNEAEIRIEELLENLRALCEPVALPRTIHEFIKYFCWVSKQDDDHLDELKQNEAKRLALYKFTGSLLRAYTDVVSDLADMNYTHKQISELKKEVEYYAVKRDEIKLASNDYIDIKTYEADMRYLIDNYLSAEASQKLSAFGEMSLLELIVVKGVDFVDSMPEGIRKNKEAAAEVIENNVRKKIVEKSGTNPLYYEKMSQLLTKIIEELKNKTIDYKAYLQKIVELARNVENPENSSNYPVKIKHSAALRAFYDNISKDVDLLLALHNKIISIKPYKWKEDGRAKEKIILKGIHTLINDDNMVKAIFEIVKEQREYW